MLVLSRRVDLPVATQGIHLSVVVFLRIAAKGVGEGYIMQETWWLSLVKSVVILTPPLGLATATTGWHHGLLE